MGRSAWREVLANPKVLAAIRDAARQCTHDGCAHQHRDLDGAPTDDPAFCDCRENLMLPGELVDWIEREVTIHRGKPTRFEKGGRPTERPNGGIVLAIAS